MPPSKAAKEIAKHAARLKVQDDDWKTRDEALARLQKLITDGALATDDFVSGGDGFEANLADLIDSLVKQLYDLRSVIVKNAIATLHILMAEVGDHAAAERPMRVDALEGLLQLAGSGNKVLSAMGREAFPKFIELVRFESIVKDDKGLLYWLGGMKQPPVKLCCLNALLQALQTWPTRLLIGASEQIEQALILAATAKEGEVRALSRQCLLQHLSNAPERAKEVEKWTKKNSNYLEVGKQLDKDELKPGGLSAEERVMPIIRRGDEGAAARNGKLGGVAAAPAPPAKKPKAKPSILKRLSSKSLLGSSSSADKGLAAPAPPVPLAGPGASAAPEGAPPAKTAKERMTELKELLDAELVTQEEFDKARQAILDSL